MNQDKKECLIKKNQKTEIKIIYLSLNVNFLRKDKVTKYFVNKFVRIIKSNKI
jgi:hypothetical protein